MIVGVAIQLLLTVLWVEKDLTIEREDTVTLFEPCTVVDGADLECLYSTGISVNCLENVIPSEPNAERMIADKFNAKGKFQSYLFNFIYASKFDLYMKKANAFGWRSNLLYLSNPTKWSKLEKKKDRKVYENAYKNLVA